MNFSTGGISGGAGPQKGIGSQSAGPGPLVIAKGDVLKAVIVEVLEDNKAVLEIAGRTITANTAISLSGMEGKTVLLKSLGSGPSGELVLKFSGDAGVAERVSGQVTDLITDLEGELQSALDSEKSAKTPDAVLTRLENVLPEILSGGAELSAAERASLGGLLVRLMGSAGPAFTEKLAALLSMSDNASASFTPGSQEDLQKLLQALAGLFPEMPQGLEDESLKTALMRSGILFESKLLARANSVEDEAKNPALEKFKNSGDDLKALLLKLRAAESGEQSDQKNTKVIDGLLKDIRVFQFISKLTGSLYSFLPVKWDGLKDGKIAFKADGQEGGSCLINLDLEGLGKISVSVFMRGAEFYVTLKIQNPAFREMVNGAADGLKNSFIEKGLSLRTVNVTGYDELPKNRLEFPGGGHLISIKL
ncbi:MAG: flagellar hook-length control protein FliK [Nitrospiraceae bacterium]|nr:flagellar hook-length control protein FliK [Nitrospiraceae bacterium]